jgi:sigma-E factor negative regulatory protein RseA
VVIMTNEQLSEWLDDELGSAQSLQVVQSLVRQSPQRDTCALYWLIGDCLRGEALGSNRPELTGRVMAALADEPTILAPVHRARPLVKIRWMPIAAAVAGFTVAVWMGLTLWTTPVPPGPVALAQKAPVAVPQAASSDAQAEVLADDRGYLIAHQASAMGEPMAGVAQYIRTVSADQAGGR